jgi:serine/threonine protein kinase
VTELLGQIIGNCRIEKLLGKGGMGRVYQAHHVHLDRDEALKVMVDAVAQDANFQARFHQEARVISELDHNHIVKLYDFDVQGGRYYLRMELLPDGSLRTLLRTLLDRRANDGRDWPLGFGLDIVRQAADALAYAHSKGIVHRDIKPDNLLLSRRRTETGASIYTLKVSDFGLARLTDGSDLTASGVALGTPAYMSPEQCQALDLDGRSDIYSLGVVLYEIVTGYPPFASRTISEAVRKHVHEQPRPPREMKADLPAEVEAVILRCLAKQPADRFATAAELSAALRKLVNGSERPDTPPSVPLTPQVRVLDAQGQTFKLIGLTAAGLTAGRLASNDLVLDNPEVGRNHLRIDWSGRTVRVTDLSARGTLLNGMPLPTQSAQIWSVGQALQVGPFTFQLENAPAPAAVTLGDGQERLSLIPGVPTQVQVQLNNRGPAAALSVVVEGLPPGWVQLPDRPLELAAGAQVLLLLPVTVPATPEGAAGDYVVTVRARSQANMAELGAARALWTVVPFVRSHLAVAPEQEHGREQASFTLRLSNAGNTAAHYSLSADDPKHALTFLFERSEAELQPGQTLEIALTVRGAPRLLGATRRHLCTVRATSAGEIQEATAQFIQTTLVPEWISPAG